MALFHTLKQLYGYGTKAPYPRYKSIFIVLDIHHIAHGAPFARKKYHTAFRCRYGSRSFSPIGQAIMHDPLTDAETGLNIPLYRSLKLQIFRLTSHGPVLFPGHSLRIGCCCRARFSHISYSAGSHQKTIGFRLAVGHSALIGSLTVYQSKLRAAQRTDEPGSPGQGAGSSHYTV